jgi:phage terminase large subunit-like protein
MAVRGKRRPTPTCPVEAYARDVIARRIVAGRLVQMASQRHLDDLAHAGKRGLVWDPAAAGHALTFFTHLRHSTGEWAHLPFMLQSW